MLLKQIMNQVVEVKLKGAKVPEYIRQDTDEVVGTLSDDLKRLYLVKVAARDQMELFHKNLDKRIKELRKKHAKEEISDTEATGEAKKITQEHSLAHNEYNLVDACFWQSVRHEFPSTVDSQEIAVTDKWEIVIRDPYAGIENSLAEAFKDMFSHLRRS